MTTKSLLRTLTMCLFVLPAQAKYGGGSGEPNDPYQIATAAELILLGGSPDDYGKHFILTADIDLDPNLTGRKVFDRAAIAPGRQISGEMGSFFQGTSFTGVFDGRDRRIWHLTVTVKDGGCGGLIGGLGPGGAVKDLRLVDVRIGSSGGSIGGLVGSNRGTVIRCYSTGVVKGRDHVGGLVGNNGSGGSVIQCYSTSVVTGTGGYVGGLVGLNSGRVTHCYGTGTVTGTGGYVGGLLGSNTGSASYSYSTGVVSGPQSVGGLVGYNGGDVTHCVWDVQASGQTHSGGLGEVGLTTVEMMDPEMLGLNGFATDPNWILDIGHDYPHLAWEKTPGQPIHRPRLALLAGMGTKDDPHQVVNADQWTLMGRASVLWDKCFVLCADISLGKRTWSTAVIPEFSGTFAGNGHVIRDLTIRGERDYLGLFGRIEEGGDVHHLGVVDANVFGSGTWIGGLAGSNRGRVNGCYSTGTVSGGSHVGGLIGDNHADAIGCHSTCMVSGENRVGGLVGYNEGSAAKCWSTGAVSGGGSVGGLVGQNGEQAWDARGRLLGSSVSSVIHCYGTGRVSGDYAVGGLVGSHSSGTVANCYSTGAVSGNSTAGGLVGENCSNVVHCYSTGVVASGGDRDEGVGGLVGQNSIDVSGLYWEMTLYGTVTDCLWDMETSSLTRSAGGEGRTTTQMQNFQTFLGAGWDFVGLVEDGLHESWKMPAGGGYPVLGVFQGYEPPVLAGQGTLEDPYLISTARELGAVLHHNLRAHYRLTADIDLSGICWSMAVIPRFAGHFDGKGCVIRAPTISRGNNLGLFGQIESGAEVYDLGVVDAEVAGSTHVGALVGLNDHGIVSHCYSRGSIRGSLSIGGLVGYTIEGRVTDCHSTAMVSGGMNSGGLIGYIVGGDVNDCYSTGPVSGEGFVGGFVGDNSGRVTRCYSIGTASGNNYVGGLAGVNSGSIIGCYSSGTVSGNDYVGGLTGQNTNTMNNCYSTGTVSGNSLIGGFLGSNSGNVANCYSAGFVSGISMMGGLAGSNENEIRDCFWDVETSGLALSAAGAGLSTAAMRNILVYLDCGWDFVGETENGTEDVWWMDKGQGYPRLRWESDEASQF